MKHVNVGIVLAATLLITKSHANPYPIDLGNAASFAVLAGSAVVNTGATVLNGNLGVWPGTSVTGFPPGILATGTIHASDTAAMRAQDSLVIAYDAAAARPVTMSLTGQDLGGLTLLPGAYVFTSSAQLTGTLTLDGQGDPNAAFVFRIGSSLTTASGASVAFLNGADGLDVFWQVGSSAALGTGTQFAGSILALTDITLAAGATIECGRALARNGTVTMNANVISINGPDCGVAEAVPEPAAITLLGLGLLAAAAAGQARPGEPARHPGTAA